MKAALGIATLCFATLGLLAPPSQAEDSAIQLSVTNGNQVLDLPLVSGIEEFKILGTTNLSEPFSVVGGGNLSGYTWMAPSAGGLQFYQVEMVPKDSNSVVSANVLNRLAYGPTPDEIARVNQMGAEGFIQEQLAPEKIQESLAIDQVNTSSDWQYVTATGTGSSSTLYIYLDRAGDCYVDDIKLVRGSVPEVGVNLLTNGGFELGLTDWTVSTNLTNSVVVSSPIHEGSQALHVIADDTGTTRDTSIWATTATLSSSQTYTLSYWYKPGASLTPNLTIRLSGSGIVSSPNSVATKLELGNASIEDLRAWHVLHAIQSKKQLLEILLQFLENHFVTQYSKSSDFLSQYYQNGEEDTRAARMEYMENKLWRGALLNPQCTFYDLLKISAESPAMIIFLDTVNSKGNGSNIANENYARELLELFSFGVDNGYDQNDITVMSRAWTGWSIRLVDPTNEFNAFAPQSTTLRPGMTNLARPDNLEGIWAFNFKTANHNTNSKTIFPNKVVPARFGAPYAGRNYQLVLPARNGTNGIKDGYEVIAHFADQPFAQEFISVKLCRLFVHDDFATGYDFTDPNLSPEGKLVRDCMLAWEQNVPKGQIRKVLEVIFNSDLFRSQSGSMQKVKTPLEFTVSAVRALRGLASDGTYTADSDGFSMSSPLNRMGRMRLFDRDAPDGYPEAGAPWISAGTLAERLRFAQAFLTARNASGRPTDAGNNFCDPVKLLKTKLSATDWNDAGKVADYFLAIIFPSEGKGNLDAFRNLAINFLNTADDGVTASLFSSVGNTTTTYDTRVRGMVAILMTSQRFQEQ
jgi:uncharacterized protein (DUF1800 family)